MFLFLGIYLLETKFMCAFVRKHFSTLIFYQFMFSFSVFLIPLTCIFPLLAERTKPKISKKPKNLEVMENKGGIFEAKISGFPKPEVKW